MDGPVHLHPTAEVAPRALLPGDPGRALLLAQALLEEPRMSNHHRGLWGYTGRAADGQALTIQSTGMGGPSAAIVVEELAMLGVRRAIRVGTCGALVDDLELGELVVAREVLAADGASRALGAEERLSADPALAAALEGDRAGLVASVDLFYDPDPPERWARRGALAVEMELAAVLAVARRRGIAAAGLLAVSDLLAGGRRQRIERGALTAAEERLGRVALAALA